MTIAQQLVELHKQLSLFNDNLGQRLGALGIPHEANRPLDVPNLVTTDAPKARALLQEAIDFVTLSNNALNQMPIPSDYFIYLHELNYRTNYVTSTVNAYLLQFSQTLVTPAELEKLKASHIVEEMMWSVLEAPMLITWDDTAIEALQQQNDKVKTTSSDLSVNEMVTNLYCPQVFTNNGGDIPVINSNALQTDALPAGPSQQNSNKAAKKPDTYMINWKLPEAPKTQNVKTKQKQVVFHLMQNKF